MPTRLLVLVTLAILTVAPCAMGQTAPGGTSTAPPQDNPPQTGTPGGSAAPPVGGSQAPAPAQPAAPRPAAPLPADYRLAIGDKLRVEVYKDPQLSQSLQVRPDGKVTLPLIGDITAAGLAPLELRDQIATALKEYVTNPVVTVIVVETVPPVVYVMGEVTNPGAIPLNGPMSVLQALAMAGGFRDFANTKNIRVLRRNARGVQTISFNYKDAVRGDGNPVTLQPGDTVIVP
jgi:polysaccharide export outer membrane protein